MPRIRIATEADLRAAVRLDAEAVDCVESAFAALAKGGVVMPPILRLDIPAANGEVDVKTAYLPGVPSFSIKISPGFFDNPKLGLPSVNGLMTLFSATTGLLEAVMLDNGYLTDVRTAAAGAVAARHLARADATSACIIGAGVQAGLQLEALTLVRPISRATIWARDPAKAQAAAAGLAARLRIEVTAAADPRAAVAAADIVVTTTPSTRPLVLADWLRPGQHLTAMGSDAEHKNELDPAAIARADLYVADSLAQTRRLGELHHALAGGTVADEAGLAELGRIVTGQTAGRTAPEQLTVCDLTGTGAQDTAIATYAMARLASEGAGTDFDA
ncbi:cyclodeaminase [Limibaculum sp. FT325]|uniref:cyclodeaminase n=1 Tax=Thermohalobaculum sediminis TaxID=2939436 RepID=UPI0020BD9403|nr:cyclodeaminase [Limibaculum sediminis]MCL5776080.1 cyclodeaminase [Limibaculum sediminis]